MGAAQTCCFNTRILSDHRVDLIEGNYTWLWKIFLLCLDHLYSELFRVVTGRRASSRRARFELVSVRPRCQRTDSTYKIVSVFLYTLTSKHDNNYF